MARKSSSDFFQRFFSVGEQTPGTPLIFLLVATISLLQIPANLLMKSVSFNLGIFVNEVFIIAGIPILVTYLLGFDRSKLFPVKNPKLVPLIFAALLAVPTALLIDYAASAGESILPLPQRYHELLNQLMVYGGNGGFFLKILVLCILPGFCEEIFFRGFCQTPLEMRWGKNKAIIITAVLFALLHGNPWYFHLYFILGFFLSWVYAVRRTLWIPITCHIINNAWTFINHTLGIKYPIDGFSSPVDVLLMLSGIVFMLFFAFAFRKSARLLDL